jgi:hypothetical protein
VPNDFFRALKAVLKTAFTWGFLLGAVSSVLITAIVFIDPEAADPTFFERVRQSIAVGIGMGVRFAFVGVVLGTLFATTVRLGFFGKRVADLHPGKFALIGAVVGGVGIPVVFQLLNVLSGSAIPWNLLFDDAPWTALVGAAGAAGTIWMARRGVALPDEQEPRRLGADELGAPDPFGEGARVREGEGVRRTT